MIGSPDTRLVVLRGNSGSGKSTVSRRLRQRLGRGVAWVEQDHLRRVVLAEHDRPGLPNIGLIDQTARYALDAGYHVVLDGILLADRYGPMINGLISDHRGRSGLFYFDIPVEETVRRHRSRPHAAEIGEGRLRSWYNAGDQLGRPGELIIGPGSAVDATVELIIGRVGFPPAPICDRTQPADHLDANS
ncbi:AAA family ATPase [Microlunatus soli]|uniref:AAA domain-containing protein n=1 Tax=Microlunatus soli TaxID=630515 RepID=A0A1H2ALR0_9ACTN|nr:AAA family ATPase [Microlunatus soli]SDT46809.1 AAA domain-containing protein [Microlunatus soli]